MSYRRPDKPDRVVRIYSHFFIFLFEAFEKIQVGAFTYFSSVTDIIYRGIYYANYYGDSCGEEKAL